MLIQHTPYDNLNKLLRDFIRNPEQMQQCGWEAISANAISSAPSGPYWISKGGKILKVQDTHVNSIKSLPPEIRQALDAIKIPEMAQSDSGDHELFGKFILASNFVRFRLTHSLQGSTESSCSLDWTHCTTITQRQERIISQLKKRCDHDFIEYLMPPNGRSELIRTLDPVAQANYLFASAHVSETMQAAAAETATLLKKTGLGIEGLALRHRIRGGD